MIRIPCPLILCPPGRLAAELLAASVWFDEALLARLEQRGWPRLSPTRSRVFLALSRGPVLVSDLARELDVSRQAVHKLLDGLQDEGLVDRGPSPTRAAELSAHRAGRARPPRPTDATTTSLR